jgi:hypothetical protein
MKYLNTIRAKHVADVVESIAILGGSKIFICPWETFGSGTNRMETNRFHVTMVSYNRSFLERKGGKKW